MMTPTFEIELANPEMATALVGLMERAYRGDESHAGWTTEAHLINGARTTIEEVLATLTKPNYRTLVAYQVFQGDRQLVGSASVSFEDGVAEFGKFAVEPRVQGSGLGKILLDAAEKVAKQTWGVDRMTMYVIRGRAELIGFYERRGYVATGGSVRMGDIHHSADMTMGHDLMLDQFAKAI